MLKQFTLFLLLFLLCHEAFAQDKRPNFAVRYFNRFINDSTDKSKLQTLAYPTIAYAPETKWEFGISAVVVG